VAPNLADAAPDNRIDVTVDVRELLRNPFRDPAMRELTGLDPLVRDYVLDTPGARRILAATGR
jgi:UPF0042 nucleotide-binding protein